MGGCLQRNGTGNSRLRCCMRDRGITGVLSTKGTHARAKFGRPDCFVSSPSAHWEKMRKKRASRVCPCASTTTMAAAEW